MIFHAKNINHEQPEEYIEQTKPIKRKWKNKRNGKRKNVKRKEKKGKSKMIRGKNDS